MINKSFPVLPVPEIIESNLNHSFKFNLSNKRVKRPPKLYPKEFSFSRNTHHEVQAISFKEQINFSRAKSSTPKVRSPIMSLSSSFYDKNKNESYFEQCFETICKLGEGSFGEVFKVRCKDDGKFYAIKKTKQIFRSVTDRIERLEEVKRYEQFSDNEHCVTLYKAWEQDDLLFMQIELCRGSVEDYIEEMKHVPETFVWSFLLDMLLALKSLHDKNLVHLDIKLDNILITDDKNCKLADFGLVFDLENSPRSRAIEGDSRYLAPELMQGNYCLANDIFSLGITLLELATSLELPSNGILWQELRSLILPEIAMSSLSDELQKIIRGMMEPNPLKRPSVQQLLNIPRLKKLRNQRRMKKVSKTCIKTFIGFYQILKFYLLTAIFIVFDFFQLRSSAQIVTPPIRSSKIRIQIHNCDEDSDDADSSFQTSFHNSSGVSKISQVDHDNIIDNNNVTPTLNSSVPRITPELKIVNSTPLNHYNHQDGVSNRKYRRDLGKLSFDTASPVIRRSSRNSSQDRDSFICKKLCFQDEELDEL